MSETLSYNAIEQFVLQIYSMDLYFEETGIDIRSIFRQLDNFLLHLCNSFRSNMENRSGTNVDGQFKQPDGVTQLEMIEKSESYGTQAFSYDLNDIRDALYNGTVVKLVYKLPIGGTFDFRIITSSDQLYACVQHSWQDGYNISTEDWMTLESILKHVSDLSSSHWKFAQKALFPDHSINDVEMENPVRLNWEITKVYLYHRSYHNSPRCTSRIELIELLGPQEETVVSEKIKLMKEKITNAYWRKELGPPIELAEESARNPIHNIIEVERSDDPPSSNSLEGIVQDDRNSNLQVNSFQCAAVIGTAVGFVFTGAGIICRHEYNENKSRIDKIKKIAMETASGGITTGIGAASKALGATVFDVGGIVAITSLVLSSSYDSIRFARGKMTKIEYRKSTASNLGGAAGGLIGGIGTTLLVTFTVSNPVGWALALGAGAVGVVGGIAGAIGARKIDKAIWDEGVDQVVHVHQFFGLDVTRNQNPIPILEPQTLLNVYDKRVRENHDPKGKNKTDVDWLKKCQALFMLLLRFMFPIYKDLLQMTTNWKEKYDSATQFEKEILQLFFDEIDH